MGGNHILSTNIDSSLEPTPPPPLLKVRGWGVGPSRHWGSHFRGRGYENFCKIGELILKRGSWCRNGGVATFFATSQFRSIAFTFSDLQSFQLAIQDFYPRSHTSLLLKPGTICTFLIHFGSLQKMLTVLFNLVRNTQKSKWAIFFERQCKVLFKRF